MHYAGSAVLEKSAPESVRKDIAAGKHLSTLAFSEEGSRSQFWAPVSTAAPHKSGIRLDAKKSWVTSATMATAFVWSSKPLAAEGPSTLWLVPAKSPGLTVQGPFDGLGLRGNDSSPVRAEGVIVPENARLGADGGGFALMMDIVLPFFNVMNAACSVGIMESAVARTIQHASGTRYQHSGSALADLPTVRAYISRMKIRTDATRLLWLDTLEALESARTDAMLRVLECKAAAGEAALEVVDTAMRVCGGAAFRKDVGVERYLRDSRAASVMGPTSDALYDFLGKALCGLPVF
jgi:alkylation response protein AidB-like acyl-CoA dehydrogenase